MKKNTYLKIITGIVVFVLLLLLITKIVIDPLIGKKIVAALHEKNSDYIVQIEKVHISVIPLGIELENITICSIQEHAGSKDLEGEITSIKLKGISLLKVLFKKEFDIDKVIITNSSLIGKIPFHKDGTRPIISSSTILVENIIFDKIDLAITNTSDSKAYTVKEGVLKMHDLKIKKLDTLSIAIVPQFDFDAEELFATSSDSMYTFKAKRIHYSSTSNILALTSFAVHPDYKDYDFTARHKFQTDRFDIGLDSINVLDFSARDFIRSGNLICSMIEIGKMNMKVFRDMRKEFSHVKKAAFQDMIYDYPGMIRIDSICFLNGNVRYSEHAVKANEAGNISFDEIKAKVYNITNDTIYKSKSTFLKLKGEALLMGKGKMTVLLKAKLFDSHNTFSLSGTLSGLDAKALNPMLEKNAFIFVTSGKIDAMNFSFLANNIKATGKMVLLYHGLVIAIKNKRTDETTAIKERLSSFIANIEVLDSNPIRKEGERVGIIDYNRDPEKFLFNYCFKSILSGIKSTITKGSKK